eukprot:scaffold2248_cov136-Skeletonema_dohrnii-CCMP3373.AAC.21
MAHSANSSSKEEHPHFASSLYTLPTPTRQPLSPHPAYLACCVGRIYHPPPHPPPQPTLPPALFPPLAVSTESILRPEDEAVEIMLGMFLHWLFNCISFASRSSAATSIIWYSWYILGGEIGIANAQDPMAEAAGNATGTNEKMKDEGSIIDEDGSFLHRHLLPVAKLVLTACVVGICWIRSFAWYVELASQPLNLLPE